MARIEVFFEYGWILGKLQKLLPPQFVTLLRNENGDMLPIYEGNNDVPPGKYDIYIYQPFKTNGEKAHKSTCITVFSEEDIICIVIMPIMGTLTAFSHDESDWENYVNSKGSDRIQRYIGWRADEAIRMLNY